MRSASILLVLALTECAPPEAHPAPHAAHWTYLGATGPDHWSALSAQFAVCTRGHEQSPVDLSGARPAESPGYAFDYHPAAATIHNNGHTVQVDYPAGSGVTIGGDRYELLQYHFHAPSEHLLEGRSFPLELHLVHRRADGRLAVVGVFIAQGAENPAYEALAAGLPAHEGERRTLPSQHTALALLPGGRTRAYRYPGSLTTPPCSEGVSWNVLEAPVELSAGQIRAFTSVLHESARPVQPLHGRAIAVDP